MNAEGEQPGNPAPMITGNGREEGGLKASPLFLPCAVGPVVTDRRIRCKWLLAGVHLQAEDNVPAERSDLFSEPGGKQSP